MEKLAIYAVGGLTMTNLLSCVMPNYDEIQIQNDDPRLETEFITYNSKKEEEKLKACFPVR
jgi:carboxymethylenebutenolidase